MIEHIKSLEDDTFGKTLDKVNLTTEMIESFFEQYENNEITNFDISNFDISKVPYPLINSTIYYDNINDINFPITFTPDYSSVPIKFISNNIDYGGYNIDIKKTCENYIIFLL